MRQTLLRRYLGNDFSSDSHHSKRHLSNLGHSIYDKARMRENSHHASQHSSHHYTSGPGSVLLSRAQMTLSEVQCHLDRQGASNLVIELIIQNPSLNIFLMSVELGIALLEGGNPFIQSSMYSKLQVSNNSEKFFRVFFNKMTSAQQEIRSTVVVTTNELMGSKSSPGVTSGTPNAVNPGQNAIGDGPSDLGKKSGMGINLNMKRNGIILTEELKGQLNEAASAAARAFQLIKSLGSSVAARRGRSQGSPSITTTDTNAMQGNEGEEESIVGQGSGSEMGASGNAEGGSSSDGSLTPSAVGGKVERPLSQTVTSHYSFDGDHTHTYHSHSHSHHSHSHSHHTLGNRRSFEGTDSNLPSEVEIMKQILRFLQLLCENHNLDLQKFLRSQSNKNNYNMVSETLLFLDCICGSTTGGLGLLGLYINEKNVSLVNQSLETLTEYCQGPCHENQNNIAGHESNAIDIIIALILNDINPLGKTRMDLVLSLKNNASKLLLAIMESRADGVNAERIMSNMTAKQLIDATVNAFHQSINFNHDDLDMEDNDITSYHGVHLNPLELLHHSSNDGADGHPSNGNHFHNTHAHSIFDHHDEDYDDDEEVTPKEVGHNIYILCHQLARHNKELQLYLKPNAIFEPGANQVSQVLPSGSAPSFVGQNSNDLNSRYTAALSYYRKHTAQIEIVRSDRTMEQIVFPVPQICEYLTEESKRKIFTATCRDEQGSKVSDFFSKTDDLYHEMRWQRKLRAQPLLYFVSSYMTTWAMISFNLAFFINIIVAISYPMEKSILGTIVESIDWSLNILLWLLFFSAIVTLIKIKYSRPLVIFVFLLTIIRAIISFGIESTLIILGVLNVLSTAIHLISIMGNRGTFTKRILQILTDFEFTYHVGYLSICILGLCIHPLFYSILLLSVVYQEETLKNVIRSVTRNGRSIILTALLAVILIYLFSIIGFLFFRDDFIIEVSKKSENHLLQNHLFQSQHSESLNPESQHSESLSPESLNCNIPSFGVDDSCADDKTNCSSSKDSPFLPSSTPAPSTGQSPPIGQSLNQGYQESNDEPPDGAEEDEDKERSCDSLLMCIVTTLNHGLRNGGGIGDVLRPPSSSEPYFILRVIYDLLFYFVVIIIILNLIFGVIIDTFADLRSEKQQKEEILRNSCFICGLERSAFDNKTTSFEDHVRYEHNMWHYLYFIVLIKVKNPTEFTGPESYVASMIAQRNLDWFPRMRAMSLDQVNEDDEANGKSHNEMKSLQYNLEATQRLVLTLSQQLADLREQVS